MHRIISTFNLALERIRGKDEYELYNNYIKDLPSERIAYCLSTFFQRGSLTTKDDSKAAQLREEGNNAFRSKDCTRSLVLYTESLCYATFGGEEYALALANRSAVYFFSKQYKSCIADINLCLLASYPDYLQPKVYIRKAKCFQELGDSVEMRRTLIDSLNVIDCLPPKFSTYSKNYKEIIKDLITSSACHKHVPEDDFEVLPVIEPNPIFLNASASISLKYSKKKGCHVVANKEIAVGDVLFVEKAYVFAPNNIPSKTDADKHCQYCLLKLTSCVPCKTCVKHLYCTESCRDSAWTEFHQWECLAVQADFPTCCAKLPFRIILKTVHKGFSAHPIHFQDGVNKYGDKEDNYPYVYNLPTNIDKINKHHLILYIAGAALLVNYLKLKTNFFQKMKQMPQYATKNVAQLMAMIGGLLVRHCGQLHCRFIPVWDYDNDYFIPNEITIAEAFCPSMSMMRHSCLPNTSQYFVGDTVVVKAIKKIQKDEDISYLYCGVPFTALEKEARQTTMQTILLMKCKCPFCMDPRVDAQNSYLCIKCKGPTTPAVSLILAVGFNVFSGQQYACLDCNYKFALPTDVIVKSSVASQFFARFNQLHDVDDANRCIELYKTIVRPHHLIFETLYTALKELYRIRGDVKGFIANAMLLLECLEEKRNGPAVKVGRDSYSYCVTALDMLEKVAPKMNLRQFREVLEMLSILVEKAKFVFNLHHAPFMARIQRAENVICELQDLYTLTVKNENK